MISPTHTCTAPHNIEHGLECPMMVRSGFGIRMHHHRASPQLVCPRACMSDGRGARHARRLRCVRVELAGSDDLDSVFVPIHVQHLCLSRQDLIFENATAMRAREYAAESQDHETAGYRVSARRSIAKPRISSAPLVGGAPFDFTAANVAGSETGVKTRPCIGCRTSRARGC